MQKLFDSSPVSLRKNAAAFLEVLKYFFSCRRSQFILLGLSILTMLVGLLNPYFGKLVVDEAIIKKDVRAFILLGCLTTAVYFVGGLLKGGITFFERRMRLKMGLDMNRAVFGHLQELPISFFQSHSTGENMYRINYDIDRIVDLAVQIPSEIVNTFPRLILVLTIIFWLDWQMAVLSVVLAPVLYVPGWILFRKMRKAWEASIQNSQNIFQFLGEKLSHMYLIKAFGKEKFEIGNYLERLRQNINLELKTVRLQIFSSLFSGSCGRIMTGAISLFGCFQVMRGRITFGTLTAIMLYLQEIVGLQVAFSQFFQNLSLGLISWRRIDEIMKVRPFLKIGLTFNHIELKDPEICFQGVSFGYVKEHPILKKLDLRITRGMVVLAGPSGCGKTTIVNLILHLYEPDAGNILIGGQDLKDFKEDPFKECISAAFQEPFLWNASVEENIRYGKEDATPEEVLEAARLSLVDDFAKDLPSGYATVIGENACKISEGQKQKIAIARALIKKPRILILDEAMSSMDSASEEKILVSLKKFKDNKTIIIVSHRLSAIMHAEKIYYLKSSDRMVVDTPQNMLHDDQDFNRLFAGQVPGLPIR